jgi:hypothetical protein
MDNVTCVLTGSTVSIYVCVCAEHAHELDRSVLFGSGIAGLSEKDSQENQGGDQGITPASHELEKKVEIVRQLRTLPLEV